MASSGGRSARRAAGLASQTRRLVEKAAWLFVAGLAAPVGRRGARRLASMPINKSAVDARLRARHERRLCLAWCSGSATGCSTRSRRRPGGAAAVGALGAAAGGLRHECAIPVCGQQPGGQNAGRHPDRRAKSQSLALCATQGPARGASERFALVCHRLCPGFYGLAVFMRRRQWFVKV